MSGFVYSEIKEKMLSFEEYMIVEKFEPKKIDFGSDYKNKKFGLFRNSRVTLFEFEDHTYFFIVDDHGTLGFTINSGMSYGIEDIQTSKFHRLDAGKALRVFNHIMYILLEYIKKYEPEFLIFSGFDEKLSKFYKLMVNNKYVLEIMKEHGYTPKVDKTNTIRFIKN